MPLSCQPKGPSPSFALVRTPDPFSFASSSRHVPPICAVPPSPPCSCSAWHPPIPHPPNPQPPITRERGPLTACVRLGLRLRLTVATHHGCVNNKSMPHCACHAAPPAFLPRRHAVPTDARTRRHASQPASQPARCQKVHYPPSANGLSSLGLALSHRQFHAKRPP